ncbi:hypothetical protein DSO57_1000396 [Entomophthora muscae]|uniref:Uncharacterized protein n=1 Tax=Entomophthora muscae TaxID=34485 RepID=A0ACC2UI54_9FUNG|nr:hypothetical protein DSO57_1000396 [Entomophthora muscae]
MRSTLLFALASAQSSKYEEVSNVVFVHGQAEHVNRYNHVFSEFAKVGIKVHAFDQVGYGLAGKLANNLGGAMGMERVKLDIDDAIDRTNDKQTPLFLMGHSFVSIYQIKGNRRHLLYGALAASPDLALAPESHPNQILVTGLIALAKASPKTKVDAQLGNEVLIFV